jgi:hypothetical protein
MEEKELPEDHGEVSGDSSNDSDRPLTAWECEVPVIASIEVDVQCYPPERRIARIRKPIHEMAKVLLDCGVKHYQISQALGTVGEFWERMSSGDAELEDFETDFDGSKRRAAKKAKKWLEHAISILLPGDQCPICKKAHVQIDQEYNIVCAGECGVVRPAPEAVCENCGEECAYHPELCLCKKCEAESQGGQDAKAERDRDDGDDGSGEAEDQGAR